VTILNHVSATGFDASPGKGYRWHTVSICETVISTLSLPGGGLLLPPGEPAAFYRSANTGEIAHRMWYSPFNTGAGYAMGIRAGAEMTGFEMRFIPTRIKDSATPTGILAQTFKIPQVNILGEAYLKQRYGFGKTRKATTCERLYYMLKEIKDGRGPIYFKMDHLTAEQIHDLKMTLLDMSPAFVLQWAANNIDLSDVGIEVATSGTLHNRRTCSKRLLGGPPQENNPAGTLYAAGDVAGGAPKKYVSGCWVEGLLRPHLPLGQRFRQRPTASASGKSRKKAEEIYKPINRYHDKQDGIFPHAMEIKLQKLMENMRAASTPSMKSISEGWKSPDDCLAT